MIVLVTGGREYKDRTAIYSVLDRLHLEYGFTFLVNGYCRGLDRIAHAWAMSRGVQPVAMPALWDHDGYSAGLKRNGRMLWFSDPHFVVAFPGGPGTANMMKQAHDARYPVYDVETDEWTRIPANIAPSGGPGCRTTNPA